MLCQKFAALFIPAITWSETLIHVANSSSIADQTRTLLSINQPIICITLTLLSSYMPAKDIHPVHKGNEFASWSYL